jgi:hypothetical protein
MPALYNYLVTADKTFIDLDDETTLLLYAINEKVALAEYGELVSDYGYRIGEVDTVFVFKLPTPKEFTRKGWVEVK